MKPRVDAPDPSLARTLRMLVWAVVFLLTLQSAFTLATELTRAALLSWGAPLSPEVRVGALFVSALVGLYGGLVAALTLVPYALRDALGARHSDQHAGVWIIPGAERPANAFVAGLGSRPSIFVTEALLASLTPEHQRAVIAHEQAHAKLGHLSTRLRQGALGLAFALVALASALFALALPPAHAPGWPEIIFVLATLGVFGQSLWLRHCVRRQEFEADRYAVTHLGIATECMRTALLKVVPESPTPTLWARAWSTHPSRDERLAALPPAPPSTRPPVIDSAAA